LLAESGGLRNERFRQCPRLDAPSSGQMFVFLSPPPFEPYHVWFAIQATCRAGGRVGRLAPSRMGRRVYPIEKDDSRQVGGLHLSIQGNRAIFQRTGACGKARTATTLPHPL